MKAVVLLRRESLPSTEKLLKMYQDACSKKVSKISFYLIGREGGISYIERLRPILLNNIKIGVEVWEVRDLDHIDLSEAALLYIPSKELRELVRRLKCSSSIKIVEV